MQGVGIKNPHNLCFAISLIAALGNCLVFQQLLVRFQRSTCFIGNVARLYQNLCIASKHGKKEAIDSQELQECIMQVDKRCPPLIALLW